MKFAIAFAVIATVATIGASAFETNAYRLSRGLPPKAPVKRATPASRMFNLLLFCIPLLVLICSLYTGARRGKPSGTPAESESNYSGQCSTGTQHCCNSVQKAGDAQSTGLLGALGLNLDPNVLVGSNCSPLTGVGISSNSWCVNLYPDNCNTVIDCLRA